MNDDPRCKACGDTRIDFLDESPCKHCCGDTETDSVTSANVSALMPPVPEVPPEEPPYVAKGRKSSQTLDGGSTMDRLLLHRASAVAPRKVQFVLGGRIPRSEVTIVCGIGGLGKSTMAGAWLAARATTGTLQGLDGPTHVLISSAEDDRSATLVPRLMADDADLERIDFIAAAQAGGRGLILPDDTPQLRAMVEETGAGLIILDPIAAHLGTDVNADKDAQVRAALAPLSDMAHDLDVIVIVVAHLNKLSSADLYQRLSGSSGFFNLARSVLLLTRDPDSDEEDSTARLLTHGKCNVGPEQSPVRMQIVPTVVTASDGSRIETSRVELGDEAPHLSAAIALDPPSDEERSDIERAADELLGLLADGRWHEAGEVKALQDRIGVSWKTMQRAAKRLNAEKRRLSEGGSGAGVWQWRIVESAQLPVEQGDTQQVAAHPRPLASPWPTTQGDITPQEDPRGHSFEAKSTSSDWTNCATCGRRFFGKDNCRNCTVRKISA